MTKITLATVKSIKPGEIAWDGSVPGFGLRARAKSKTYFLKARARGRSIWLKIGDVGAWTPEKARREAQRRLRELSQGVDPEKLRQNPKGLSIVGELIDRYVAEHLEVRNRPTTIKGFQRLLDVHIRPEIGKRPIADVNSADVAKLQHKLRTTPRQANQVLAVLSKMFSLAERWHLRPLNSNPCRGLERFKEKSRDRFLRDAELAKLGETLAAMEKAGEIVPGIALAIRLLALTGCRLGEILGLMWDDVDKDNAALNLREAKAGARRHTIGASTAALLNAVDRVGPYVAWSTNPKNPIPVSTMSAAWKRIRTKAGIPDVRMHDLRHGFGTFAGQTSANAFLVRDALGHKTLAMSGRYVNRDEDPLKRLVDRVSNRIATALSGEQADVEQAPDKMQAGDARRSAAGGTG